MTVVTIKVSECVRGKKQLKEKKKYMIRRLTNTWWLCNSFIFFFYSMLNNMWSQSHLKQMDFVFFFFFLYIKLLLIFCNSFRFLASLYPFSQYKNSDSLKLWTYFLGYIEIIFITKTQCFPILWGVCLCVCFLANSITSW